MNGGQHLFFFVRVLDGDFFFFFKSRSFGCYSDFETETRAFARNTLDGVNRVQAGIRSGRELDLVHMASFFPVVFFFRDNYVFE